MAERENHCTLWSYSSVSISTVNLLCGTKLPLHRQKVARTRPENYRQLNLSDGRLRRRPWPHRELLGRVLCSELCELACWRTLPNIRDKHGRMLVLGEASLLANLREARWLTVILCQSPRQTTWETKYEKSCKDTSISTWRCRRSSTSREEEQYCKVPTLFNLRFCSFHVDPCNLSMDGRSRSLHGTWPK